MTVERSKRRCFLTLTFLVKSVSKNLLIRITNTTHKIATSFSRQLRGTRVLKEQCSHRTSVVAPEHSNRKRQYHQSSCSELYINSEASKVACKNSGLRYTVENPYWWRKSHETPLGPGAKKDGCFRRLQLKQAGIHATRTYLQTVAGLRSRPKII